VKRTPILNIHVAIGIYFLGRLVARKKLTNKIRNTFKEEKPCKATKKMAENIMSNETRCARREAASLSVAGLPFPGGLIGLRNP